MPTRDQRVLLDDPFDIVWETKVFGFRGSMFAKLKLKGIDGRAPPGVELAAEFDSTRGYTPGPDIVRIDR